MSLPKCCTTGVIHEGKPKGGMQKIEGVDCYVAKPDGDFDNRKAILIFTDVFGVTLPNIQLIADSFAANGYQTYVPDLFDGEIPPPNAMQPGSDFDFQEWIGRHMPPTAQPVAEKMLKKLESDGVLRIGGVGYCYGAKLTFWNAFEHRIKAAVVNHPSLLEIPSDPNQMKESRVPLLINSCETDVRFPKEDQAKADEVFGHSVNYKRTYWKGCTHGFAVRGDMSNPDIKSGKEGAFNATIEWFQAKL